MSAGFRFKGSGFKNGVEKFLPCMALRDFDSALFLVLEEHTRPAKAVLFIVTVPPKDPKRRKCGIFRCEQNMSLLRSFKPPPTNPNCQRIFHATAILP
jgi:hypothetical protein